MTERIEAQRWIWHHRNVCLHKIDTSGPMMRCSCGDTHAALPARA